MTSMTRKLAAALVAIAFTAPSLASAKGTVRLQQADGSVQLYENATIQVVAKKLHITTANGKGTLVITDAACSYVGKLMRCLPFQYVLQQNGTHPLDFDHGTIYYNPTQEKQQMTYSSMQLEPEGVLIAAKSKKGTYLTVTGTLDGRRS